MRSVVCCWASSSPEVPLPLPLTVPRHPLKYPAIVPATPPPSHGFWLPLPSQLPPSLLGHRVCQQHGTSCWSATEGTWARRLLLIHSRTAPATRLLAWCLLGTERQVLGTFHWQVPHFSM